jgi:hypothetical protein
MSASTAPSANVLFSKTFMGFAPFGLAIGRRSASCPFGNPQL